MLQRVLSSSAVGLAVWVASASADSPAIGLISASGPLTINRSQVWGNATIFDGTSVETGQASGDLALRNGVRMQLGTGSRAQVWQNHFSLEKGSSQVSSPGGYQVDAAEIVIKEGAASRMRVAMAAGNRVEVTALIGTVQVNSRSGILLGLIPAGRTMSFAPQSSSATTTRTGCLLYKSNHFILHDDATTEVVELSGTGLSSNVGDKVEVSGTPIATKPTVSIATVVMSVSHVTPKSSGGCLTVAAALDASTSAPAATDTTAPAASTGETSSKAGMSTGAKVAIAAVVIGGAVGGIAAATLGHKSTSP
jgi:hypothetical protein